MTSWSIFRGVYDRQHNVRGLLHPAMRHVGPVRRELGFPTVMNILGPLTNPAGVGRQLVGVADPSLVTFESVNWPGYFIRHQNFQILIATFDGSDLFLKDATFRPYPGLADRSCSSYEAMNYPVHFIRHEDFMLHLRLSDGSESFRNDATFRTLGGLAC